MHSTYWINRPENEEVISYNVFPLYTQPKRPGEIEEWTEIDKGVPLAPSTLLVMFLLWCTIMTKKRTI